MPDISLPRLYYPKSATLFHRYATVVVGNVLVLSHDGAQDFSHHVSQSPNANGDTFTYPFCMAAGSYTLDVLGVKLNSCGKLDWYIDNVLAVAGQDWYAAGATYLIIFTTAVTVIGSGWHTLKGVVNGKNVASGGYRIALTAVSLY